MDNQNHYLFGANGQPLYTTEQAAAHMGKPRTYLVKLMYDHPQIRPAIRVGQLLFWTDGEIEAAAQQKATGRVGRPAKN